ncbi:MAG: hypothetical protein H6878_10115 [Rhodobiaceae bacterium]|nr:hypothetical protein [Rhodobiaceae bacterium]MCC0016616.1 hypothetical protein [Rhodobiaceae bacterium]MCC0042267.1 hypothetical protein [Rhodobiaceae bacterium]
MGNETARRHCLSEITVIDWLMPGAAIAPAPRSGIAWRISRKKPEFAQIVPNG